MFTWEQSQDARQRRDRLIGKHTCQQTDVMLWNRLGSASTIDLAEVWHAMFSQMFQAWASYGPNLVHIWRAISSLMFARHGPCLAMFAVRDLGQMRLRLGHIWPIPARSGPYVACRTWPIHFAKGCQIRPTSGPDPFGCLGGYYVLTGSAMNKLKVESRVEFKFDKFGGAVTSNRNCQMETKTKNHWYLNCTWFSFMSSKHQGLQIRKV